MGQSELIVVIAHPASGGREKLIYAHARSVSSGHGFYEISAAASATTHVTRARAGTHMYARCLEYARAGLACAFSSRDAFYEISAAAFAHVRAACYVRARAFACAPPRPHARAQHLIAARVAQHAPSHRIAAAHVRLSICKGDLYSPPPNCNLINACGGHGRVPSLSSGRGR